MFYVKFLLIFYIALSLPVNASDLDTNLSHYLVFEKAPKASNPNSGFYVGAEVGYTQNRLIGPGSGLNDEKGANYGGFIGYQFNEYFGLEGGYNQTGTFSKNSRDPIDPSFNVNSSYDIKTYSIDALGYIPVANRLDLIAGIGYEKMYIDQTVTANNGVFSDSFTNESDEGLWRFSAGARVKMTDHLSVRVMYRYRDLGDSDDADGTQNYLESKNDVNLGVALQF